MIRLLYTLDGAATVIERDILMTDTEAGKYGQAVSLTSERLTKATADAFPFALLIADTIAGNDVETEYIPVREDQVFEIDVVGSTLPSTLVGKKAALDSNAMNINADSETPGKALVLRADDTKKKVIVRFVQ